MKSLVFIAGRVSQELTRLCAVLSKVYQIHTLIGSHGTLSVNEYINGDWDTVVVCDDYSIFVCLPIKARKIIIWKTTSFDYPVLSNVKLDASLLSNLVHDGIVKSSEAIVGEGEILDSPRKWVSFIDEIPLDSVPAFYPVVGIKCNWTRTLVADWQKLVPPDYPLGITDKDGEITFVFNGCDRFPHVGDVITTMEPECNRGHISPVWKVKERNINRNMIEWHLSLPWEEVEKPVMNKDKVLSAIVSGENRLDGHQKRQALARYLDDKLEFDLYGRHPHQLKNYKGPLTVKDPGLLPYKYHIATENCQENGYFTEKIVDAILAECLCFYWGCPDIDKYIDPRAYIRIPLEKPEECLRIITEAISNNEWGERLSFIRNEKWRIMNGWSIFPTIKAYIDKTLPNLDQVIYILNPPGRFEEWVRVTKKMVGKPYRRIESLDQAPDGATIVEDTDI